MKSSALYGTLCERTEYESFLYRFGFLITDNVEEYCDEYTFLNAWHCFRVRNMHFWIHPDQILYLHHTNDADFFLIGHCYDPLRMVYSESDILKNLSCAWLRGQTDYCRVLNDLTGIFVTGYITRTGITVYGDAAGMLMTYYGIIGEKIYISSHADLLGNINALEMSEYVKRLTDYRFYSLFGRSLPGDLSPYDAFKRLIPNHCVEIQSGSCTVRRFYPTEDWEDLIAAMPLEDRVREVTRILKNTMALIPKKWDRPAISLTGGCDSKTTLACAAGHYHEYSYFSYVSQQAEKVDADGAHVICEKLKLPHTVYEIPEVSGIYSDLELAGDIISANQGHIGRLGQREIQKRMYLSELDVFDVEVKSWVSEVARAYYNKRFDKMNFPAKPTPRYLTTLYKVFFHDRKLVRDTDRIFAEYMCNYLREEQMHGWSWLDLFFWEFRVGSWNGLVITGEHRYSGEITIPYNNRRLLTLMLAVPLEMKMEDKLYAMVRQDANPAVDDAGIAITNLKHTNNRAKLERLYLEVHSRVL